MTASLISRPCQPALYEHSTYLLTAGIQIQRKPDPEKQHCLLAVRLLLTGSDE